MIYVTVWTFKPEHRDAVQARFKQTGGLPPEGVKMLGRWHGTGTNNLNPAHSTRCRRCFRPNLRAFEILLVF